jgi:arginyl-tRNA synthetase
MGNLPQSEIIESCSVAGPGFVNIVLSNNWMAKVLFKSTYVIRDHMILFSCSFI